MSNIFVKLRRVMLPGDSLKFSITCDGEILKVIVQPIPPKEVENATPEIQRARAALTVPLLLSMTPAELDTDFEARVDGYADARHRIYDPFATLLDQLNETAKATQVAAQKPAKSTVVKTTPAVTSKPGKGNGVSPSTPQPATPSADSSSERSDSSTPDTQEPLAGSMDQPLSLF